MRRLWGWGVGSVLLVGLGGVGFAGEVPSGGGTKPAVRPLISTTPKKGPTEPATSADQQASAVIKREEAAYWRRLAVCDKLRDIAYQTGDANLDEVAGQLEQKAFDVYQQRIANLSTAPDDGGADEQRLGKVQQTGEPVGARLERGGRPASGQQDARNSGPGSWFRR